MCVVLRDAGLYPDESSFDLLQPEYLASLGLKTNLIDGYVSTLQRTALDLIKMAYCRDTTQLTCNIDTQHSVVCKVLCTYRVYLLIDLVATTRDMLLVLNQANI